ncbi:MAG: hypothetical protein KUG77_19410 [Nannocystaceae bacterium]|nr:hypothetical protein [Nannocystaceae bacterium]
MNGSHNLQRMLASVLPVDVGSLRISLGAWSPRRVGESVEVALVACGLDGEGEILAVVEERITVIRVEHLEATALDRARAFFAGWREALPSYARLRGCFDVDPAMLSSATVCELAPPYRLLDDLGLQSREDFADAVARAEWL